MNRDEKAAAIAEIAGDISESQAIFAVDPTGLSVSQAAEIRTQLRNADAKLRVVKNTLTERAADEAGLGELKELLTGPTALTFVRGDAAAAAKAISDYAKATDRLPFKGGFMDGAALEVAQIQAIAKLPSRDVLYGQLVGMIASPITGLARGLNALLSGVAIALGQVQAKAEAGEIQLGAGAAAAEPEPEPAPAAEAEGEPAAETAEEPAAEPAAEAPAEVAEEPAAESGDETTTDADQDAEAPDAGDTPHTEDPAEGPDDTSTETTEE
jgi:large subunit ribosomal protein L10